MRRIITSALVLIIISPAILGSGVPTTTRLIDEFGDINCEDEMARLDNFALHLQNDPSAKGLIVFYSGRRFKGRLPKPGEAEARAARLRPYLVDRRGVPKDQVMLVGWGYTEDWHVQLWIVPRGAAMPERKPTIPAKEIKFRKGKVRPRDFRCQI